MTLNIYGRVQMVMFRDFATRMAKKHDVLGWVKNISDGSVRAVGEGTREALEAWIADVAHGSFLSRVDRVDTTWSTATGEFSVFTLVRY